MEREQEGSEKGMGSEGTWAGLGGMGGGSEGDFIFCLMFGIGGEYETEALRLILKCGKNAHSYNRLSIIEYWLLFHLRSRWLLDPTSLPPRKSFMYLPHV